jgi:hypothetical protein
MNESVCCLHYDLGNCLKEFEEMLQCARLQEKLSDEFTFVSYDTPNLCAAKCKFHTSTVSQELLKL